MHFCTACLQEEPFMDTIDPEVRADVEYAGRLLAKAIARRQLQVGRGGLGCAAGMQPGLCTAAGQCWLPSLFAHDPSGDEDRGPT